MSFCLVLVVYRFPDFFLHFLYKDSRTRNQNMFFVPKMGCPGLQGTNIFSIYMFLPCIYELLLSAGGLYIT